MKYKIEIKALKEGITKQYTIEASNNEEYSRELARIHREWVNETGITNFTLTSCYSMKLEK